jgi:hypothetical protein
MGCPTLQRRRWTPTAQGRRRRKRNGCVKFDTGFACHLRIPAEMQGARQQHLREGCASGVPQRRSVTVHRLSFLTGCGVSTGGRGSSRRGGRGGA